MTRREYGSGGIYHNVKRSRWEGTIQNGWNRNGGRKVITVTGRTEAEVKRKLRDKRLELDKGHVTGGRITVKAWAETWLAMRAHGKKPKTYGTDKGAVEKWIVPTIGHVRLDQLTPDDVRAVTVAVRKARLSTTTALRYHAVLRKMLKAAVLDGKTVPPHALVVEAPVKAVNDRQALATPQALAVLAVAAREPNGSRWAAALLQGMRQGECLGLTWDAVGADRLTVDWQLQALPYIDAKQKTLGFRVPDGFEAVHLEKSYHLIRPKSGAGRRVIPLVPWMAEALDHWRTIAPVSPHGLVWPRPSGAPMNPKDDRDAWEALQQAAQVAHPTGRPYYLHEARHTTATLLMELKVPESVRIAIMGHSTIAVTRGYEYVDIAEARRALEALAGRLMLGQ